MHADTGVTTEDYSAYVSSLKDDPKADSAKLATHTELCGAFSQYMNLKKEQGVFDFHDLLSQTFLLFKTCPTVARSVQYAPCIGALLPLPRSSRVASAMPLSVAGSQLWFGSTVASRYRHVLVDEYQDVNPAIGTTRTVQSVVRH